MAAFAYQVQAAAEPAIYLSDTSSSPIHHHHAGAQNYQIAPGFTTDLPSPTSSCFPFLSYSSYPVPYYDPVRAQESRGSSMDDDDDIISPPLSTQQAPAQASLSQSSSQESVDVEKKRKQGKLQGAADEACDHRAKKQRKCGGGRNKGNANKGSSAARRNAGGGRREQKNAAETPREPPPEGYIHVRARRGQATDSHSLAERVRREKISARMKLLQELVPGCDKVTGKALMLDEIINYVQSLQHQVEFLSMKLASLSPVLYDFGPDLDHYMAQLQKVERLSPSSPVQHTQAGNHIVVQTSSATTAGFTKTTNVYNAEHTRTGDSSVVPYLMQGCHTGLPTTTPASTYSLQQGNGSSSLLQVVGGDNNTHPFLNQLQFATNNNNNLCSFQ